MMKKTLSIALLIICGIAILNGQDSDGDETRAIRTAVPFLTIAPDSKAGALGDAGAATESDLSSQHWNLSKYVFSEEQAGIGISYTPWLRNLGVNDLNLLYLSGFYKFDDRQSISGGLRYFNLGEITELNDDGDETGNTINPHEFAIDAGYSRKFSEYFSGGLAFRFIYSNIASGTSESGFGGGASYEPGTSVAADLSTYYQRPTRVAGYDAEWAWGLNISNIGNKMGYSDDNVRQFIPTNLRLGGRFKLDIDNYNSIAFVLDLNKLLVPYSDTANRNISPLEGMVKSFYDAPGGAKEEFQEIMWSVGAEYWYMKQFAVRMGYFHEHELKGNRKYFTAGVGLQLNVFSLDFSYLFPTQGGQSNPLGNTMRFTLGFRFE